MTHDPISDLLTRIRNAQKARKATVRIPDSRFARSVLGVLAREGYVGDHTPYADPERPSTPFVELTLRYYEDQPVIQEVKRVSKPGRRVYSGIDSLPKVKNGLGIYVLSTPKGVFSDAEARHHHVGGEVLCQVY